MANQDQYPNSGLSGAFDRLPRRLRAFLLMLVMLVPAVISLVTGVRCARTGDVVVVNHISYGAGAVFLIAAGCFAIAGALFGVTAGWIKPKP